MLQSLGSRTVRFVSGVDVPDAVSGIRAITREAALRINIVSGFSYTIEMLIQAGRNRMAVLSVPVATNPVTRQSRLFKTIPGFMKRSLATMLRIYAMYQPLKVFAIASVVFGLAALSILGVLWAPGEWIYAPVAVAGSAGGVPVSLRRPSHSACAGSASASAAIEVSLSLSG